MAARKLLIVLAAAAAVAACSSSESTRASNASVAPADEAFVTATCGACHAPPTPDRLSRSDWKLALGHMRTVMARKKAAALTDQELSSLLAYYQARSPATLEVPPPTPRDSPIRFEAAPLGRVRVDDPQSPGENGPAILNLNAVDLDGDGGREVVVCEDIQASVSRVRRAGERWVEDDLATASAPAHSAVVDVDGDGDLDMAVANLGSLMPTEQPVGAVSLLINDGAGRFASQLVLSQVGRVADVQPADFDGDGDVDFVVAIFGFIDRGEIGWLEQTAPMQFAYRRIIAKPGAMRVPVVDLDGDGSLDFVAMLSQDSEEVVGFLNRGAGAFEARTLFREEPTWGASGMELVDLDRDGDVDIVMTNGDAFDARGFGPRPYHGVSWLENRGGLAFVRHEIAPLLGAYAAAVGDLDGDGDLDIAAVSMFNDWSDTRRQSLIWLENDGHQRFRPHGVGNAPIHLVTVALADLDDDGRLDILTGGIHGLAPPAERQGRITVWWNRGRR